jgi:hypothetical protein
LILLDSTVIVAFLVADDSQCRLGIARKGRELQNEQPFPTAILAQRSSLSPRSACPIALSRRVAGARRCASTSTRRRRLAAPVCSRCRLPLRARFTQSPAGGTLLARQAVFHFRLPHFPPSPALVQTGAELRAPPASQPATHLTARWRSCIDGRWWGWGNCLLASLRLPALLRRTDPPASPSRRRRRCVPATTSGPAIHSICLLTLPAPSPRPVHSSRAVGDHYSHTKLSLRLPLRHFPPFLYLFASRSRLPPRATATLALATLTLT